jgi:cbb3-type cytochrome oxidase maturation protein
LGRETKRNMQVILILILISLTIALVFLAGFIWAVKSGQFDDTCTPSMRILTEEEPSKKTSPATNRFKPTEKPKPL